MMRLAGGALFWTKIGETEKKRLFFLALELFGLFVSSYNCMKISADEGVAVLLEKQSVCTWGGQRVLKVDVKMCLWLQAVFAARSHTWQPQGMGPKRVSLSLSLFVHTLPHKKTLS